LVREDIWRCIRLLKSRGQSILLVDKNLDALLGLADRHYVLEKGRIVWNGPLPDAAAAEPIKTRYLGL
jgi:branched-chain amino acid transport system ATP-binding protein